MRNWYLKFLKGISVNGFSKLGAALVTSSFIVFVFLQLLWFTGALTNAYIGLITYLALPALFITGLLLIPFGWMIWRRKTGESLKELLTKRFDEDDLAAQTFCARLSRTVIILTLINLLFLSLGGMRMLNFMDQPHFCGTACHSVMNPEWTTYQVSPHAHVKCVECHVGEGLDALIDSKFNGVWQMISVTFNLYERPIPTPVRNLRPARETCEKCHWPDMFHGNRIKTIVHYDTDSLSTPRYTTLLMKIGSGERGLERGSHWHVSRANELRYASVNDEREEMIWVDVRGRDGNFKRFHNTKPPNTPTEPASVRTMDCVDCHNRATHIYEKPEWAIDRRMQRGLIDRRLPFVKREVLGALIKNYPDKANGMKMIDTRLQGFYSGLRTEDTQAPEAAVETAQEIYQRNIHPGMNITWGSYPNHLGHRFGRGCLRCHNSNLVDEEGEAISMDCTLCHSILALEGDEPFEYLLPTGGDTTDATREIHRYLRREFIDYMGD